MVPDMVTLCAVVGEDKRTKNKNGIVKLIVFKNAVLMPAKIFYFFAWV